MRRTCTCTAWALLLVVAATGCYTTRIRSGTARSGEAVHERRQWFTVGGLVPLSSAAGGECGEDGLSYADSRLGGIDILLNIAIGVGSSLVGVAICDDGADPETYAACVSGAGALGGFLIGSRSVRYQCRASTGP
jgi:hypothetical protein